MGKQTKLEKIAIESRNNIIKNNIYNSYSDKNNYTPTHSRAISDKKTPVHGKGTGKFLDIENGGGSEDVNGVTGIIGSGRNGNVKQNEYNKNNKYEHPDTSKNIGQVVI